MRFYHNNKWSHPVYVLLEKGYGNKKLFTMGVLDKDKNVILKATDTSKRKAEQKVSKFVLYKYNKLNKQQINNSEANEELEMLN